MTEKYIVVCGDLSSRNKSLKYPTYQVTGEKVDSSGWSPKLAICLNGIPSEKIAKLFTKEEAQSIINKIIYSDKLSALDSFNPRMLLVDFGS